MVFSCINGWHSYARSMNAPPRILSHRIIVLGVLQIDFLLLQRALDPIMASSRAEHNTYSHELLGLGVRDRRPINSINPGCGKPGQQKVTYATSLS